MDIFSQLENSITNLARRIKDLENKAPQYAPVQAVTGTGNLTLSGVDQLLTGVTVTLYPANYQITAQVDAVFDAGDAGNIISVTLYVGGVAQGHIGNISVTGGVVFNWLVNATVTSVIEVKAKKSGGAGTSYINCANSNMLVMEIM